MSESDEPPTLSLPLGGEGVVQIRRGGRAQVERLRVRLQVRVQSAQGPRRWEPLRGCLLYVYLGGARAPRLERDDPWPVDAEGRCEHTFRAGVPQGLRLVGRARKRGPALAARATWLSLEGNLLRLRESARWLPALLDQGAADAAPAALFAACLEGSEFAWTQAAGEVFASWRGPRRGRARRWLLLPGGEPLDPLAFCAGAARALAQPAAPDPSPQVLGGVVARALEALYRVAMQRSQWLRWTLEGLERIPEEDAGALESAWAEAARAGRVHLRSEVLGAMAATRLQSGSLARVVEPLLCDPNREAAIRSWLGEQPALGASALGAAAEAASSDPRVFVVPSRELDQELIRRALELRSLSS